MVILILRLGADGIVPMWNSLLDRLFPPRVSDDEPQGDEMEKEPVHA